MNADLAFCLDKFVEDQINLIDGILQKIQEEEVLERDEIQKIQGSPDFIEQRRISKIKKGTHTEDRGIVDRFIQDLQERDILDNQPNIHDNHTDRDGLRAEIKTKLSACSSYVTRLGKLAKRMLNSIAFQQYCYEAHDLLSEQKFFDEKFSRLCDILEESDLSNCVENVEQWWKEAFGNIITFIDNKNKRFNPAISEKNYAKLSHRSRIMQRAMTMVENQGSSRVKQLQRYDIIYNFIYQIQSTDDNNHDDNETKDLIEYLTDNDNQIAIDYAKKWLKQRDFVRSQKEENALEIRWQMAKAEFNRQRIAQESKKVALAVLLQRLAVGSDNTEHFNQNLKRNIAKQQDHTFPIIIGDIKDPTIEELPLSIELFDVDVDEWLSNTNQIQDQFAVDLCVALNMPIDKIRTDNFIVDNSILKLFVLVPYGNHVINSLNGTAIDSSARLDAVHKCCASLDMKVESITIGDLDLTIEKRLMDPQWNRKYIFSHENDNDGHYWEKPLTRGGKPYHCPSGWMRFGIQVTENDQEFDRKCGDWYIAYHGTQGENAASILSSGLRVSTTGCFYEKGRTRVYVSPSIEYCAHPHYAYPWKKINENGETSWYQLVFQCRVNPKSVKMIEPETLINNDYKKTVEIDTNFDNNELTWVIPAKEGIYYMNEDIICYGLMMRISTIDPKELPQSEWWQHAMYIKYDT